MANRAEDWLRQAERDLAQAASSLRDERHEWACFAAQQAAEKAVKALHHHLRQDVWCHMVVRLLQQLPAGAQPTAELVDKAHVLDNYYVAPRYPNGHPEGAPFEYYGPLQSQDAIRYAGEIIEFVRAQMA